MTAVGIPLEHRHALVSSSGARDEHEWAAGLQQTALCAICGETRTFEVNAAEAPLRSFD